MLWSIRWAVGLLPLMMRPHSSAVAPAGVGTVRLAAPIQHGRPGGVPDRGRIHPRANFWADLLGKARRAAAAVEGAHVGVGLLEAGVLGGARRGRR